MMLRSSSTPILGSLLSSYSESPSHGNYSEFNSPKHLTKKFPFHQTQLSHLNLITPSAFCNSSPSDSCPSSRSNGFRRVQSDGNLEGLASASYEGFDELNHSIPNKKFPRKPKCAVLQTIPSDRQHEDDEEEEEDEESGEEAEEKQNEGLSIEKSMAYMKNIGLSQERYIQVVEESESRPPSKMHLAIGLGAVTGGFNEYKPICFGDDGSNKVSTAEYYKKMVEENPGNPLILRNYAEFLHKSKDLGGAEEYYSRAILVDSGDGEILSQYAQVTWELHGDEERASSYFQRAVQASPENSHVHAAYASFLWETEEGDDIPCTIPTIIHQSATATAQT